MGVPTENAGMHPGEDLGSQAYVFQNCFLSADTAKAFTTVLAGLALMTRISPNTSFLQALVAGFFRNLIMHNPGRVNLPLFTPCAPISAKESRSLLHCDFLRPSTDSANFSQMAPLVMDTPALVAAFIAFMGAMVTVERVLGSEKNLYEY